LKQWEFELTISSACPMV